METDQGDGRPYCVIRFIEIPYEGVDSYVCVPYSWIVVRRSTDKKVAVAYPSDEDPFDTRDRAMRKEKYKDEWKFYMAEIKYEIESYREAEYWIASRNNLNIKVVQPETMSDKKTPSRSQMVALKSKKNKPRLTHEIIKNLQKHPTKMSQKEAAQLGAVEQHVDNRSKLDNAAQTSSSAGNYIITAPGCSKDERSIVIGERDQTEAAATLSSYKPTPSQLTREKRHRSSPVRQAKEQLPSVPTEVISSNEGAHLQGEKQPSEASSNNQSLGASNTTTASMALSQPSTSVQQSSHPDHQRHSQNREDSYSNIQPVISEVRSIRETNTVQTSCPDEIPNNEPYASRHLPVSLTKSTQLYNQMKEKTSLIPMHESVETRIRLVNSEKLMAIAAQKPSNLMDQRRSSPSERREPTVSQISSLNIPHFEIKIGKSYDMNTLDPKIILERVDNVASGTQHNPCLPYERPSFVRRVEKHQNLQPLEQCQQQPMGVPDALQGPSGSYSTAQKTNLEELFKHKASTVQGLPNPVAYQHNPGNFHQEQRQELRRASTEGINPAQPTVSGIEINIPGPLMISTNIANQTVPSLNSSQQRQPLQYHRDVQQQPHPSISPVGIPTSTSNDSRLPTIHGVTQRSPPHAQLSIPDSMRQSMTKTYTDYLLNSQRFEARLQGKPIDHDLGSKVSSPNILPAASQQSGRELFGYDSCNVCQTSLPQQRPISQHPEMAMKPVHSESYIFNLPTIRSPPRSVDKSGERVEVRPVSPDQGNSSGREVIGHPGVISEQMTFTNNASSRKTADRHGSASANNQSHARFALEQQMLTHFSTILSQMGSNLYYSCEMFKNLRSSILETADTYKKLLGVVEKFNVLAASESAASVSATRAPRSSPSNEERQPRAVKRAMSTNRNQHGNKVDKEPPNKKHTIRWKVLLPAEYDPNSTEWTLKYRKMVPGLKELLPGRGIYVNSNQLMYVERVSSTCMILASLVVEEVFSESALMTCSTWQETKSPKSCWVDRPMLDPAAWDALLTYVIQYGNFHGWNVDTREIMKDMDSKIYEIRVKHDVMAEPYSP